MKLPVLEDLPPVAGKSVLVRCDLNVPLHDGSITDDLRIRLSVETLAWLFDHDARRVTVCTHLGRPKGRPDPRYSVRSVRARLEELLKAAGADISRLDVRENLRFSPGEEDNDPAFVDELVSGQDVYVDDAFGAAHRAHASIVGPPARLPSAAGRLLAREVAVLGGLLERPRRPFIAVLGGAKVSDKLGVIESLLARVDGLLVGGGMCFTFLAAAGHGVGASLLEEDQLETCRRVLKSGLPIHLPTDLTALSPGGRFGPDEGDRSGDVRQLGVEVPAGWRALDIGPGTAAAFADTISEGATVFWNGPMGVFEDPRFAAGTRTVAAAVADCRGFTVVGGGDSAAALAAFNLDGSVNHVSTGGGASLELLEYGTLPGLEALRDAAERDGGLIRR